MPFSSVLGASSVIKPGVCTSTTRPTVPYEGQLIYETDTDMVASYNGSAWVSESPGLQHIRTTTFSSVSSVAVDNVFTSQHANYFLTFEITAASGTNADIRYQYRAGGVDTTTLYVTEFISQYSGTATSGEVSVGIVGSVDTTYPVYSQGNAVIQSPQLAQRTVMTVNGGWVNNLGQPRQLRFFSYQDSATQFDGIKLFTSSGTFTGTFRIYGYRK